MGTAQNLGLSLAMGMTLFSITILLGWINTTYNINGNFLKWVVLPVLGYGIAFGINGAVHSSSCKTFNAAQVALGNLSILGAILITLLITLSSFIRSFIEVAVPPVYRNKYGGAIALGFYLFWAGMFGESIAGGFAQSCAS
jgi:uncharacterized MnhB-related membrane protein